MSKNYAFIAEKRDSAGKGAARALRRENKIPAVIYGDSKAPVTITLPSKDANLEYNKGQMFTTLCDLDVEGEKNVVLARDVQLHPVTDVVQHIDFLRVTKKTSITVSVPVNFIGYEDSPAAKEKGTLNTLRYEIDLVCKAMNIPDTVDIDMTGANIGDSIKSSDVTLPEGSVFAIDDRDFTIASVAAPRTIADDEPEEGEEEGAEGDSAAAEGEEKAEGAAEEKSE